MNTRKNILIIAPSSLPICEAESIVNAKLLKALSEDGRFEIDLISKDKITFDYPKEDNYESWGIHIDQLKLVKVDNRININTIFQHIKTFCKFGTAPKGSHWALAALSVAEKMIKGKKYDYVLTKSSPSLLVGAYLKKKYGLKWIASWNDPFPLIKYPAPYGKGWDARPSFFDKQMIKIMSKYPDMHIFPSDRLRDHMLRYLTVNPENTIIIPHTAITGRIFTKHSFPVLRLYHPGNLAKPRDPSTFLHAFKSFIDENPNAKISFTILGKADLLTKQIINDLQLENYVKILPPVSYYRSLEEQSNYNVAIIIEAACAEGVFLPTKVSDFVEVMMPVFAVSPNSGVLHDLYDRNIIPYFADVKSVNSIKATITRIYNDYLKGEIVNTRMPEEYSAHYIAEAYYNIK